MHPALLIDEIIRQIFHFCFEYDQRSLICAARTCKAWRDPALDLVWNRLFSLGPLLFLLPGITISNNEYTYQEHPFSNDVHRFNFYARRVKHISNKQRLKINSPATTRLPLSYANGPYLPNLTKAHISIPRTDFYLMPFNLSRRLIHLDIDLGFQKREADVSTILCEYLERVHSCCSDLRHLSIRGLANTRLNQIISTMRNLESLSLRLGHSLLSETLLALKTFPNLTQLEVHAGHIELDDSNDTFQLEDLQAFPLLRKLHIRARSSLIENMMLSIPRNTLYHLHLELDDPTPSGSSWNSIFNVLYSKTSDTIQHLALEHHYEIPETPLSVASGTPQNIQGADSVAISMPFETLQMLCRFKALRHFSLDLTLPTFMSDDDADKIISWWPDLEHLEIGSVPQTNDVEAVATDKHLTVASLTLFASKSPKLKRLIIPLRIDDLPISYPLPPIKVPSQLRNLTIAQLNTPNPFELGQYLQRLFPSLDRIEGPCDDVQPWINVNHALHM